MVTLLTTLFDVKYDDLIIKLIIKLKTNNISHEIIIIIIIIIISLLPVIPLSSCAVWLIVKLGNHCALLIIGQYFKLITWLKWLRNTGKISGYGKNVWYNKSLYYAHKKYYIIWSRQFFKNDCATITDSYLSGVGNFCTLWIRKVNIFWPYKEVKHTCIVSL